MSGISCYEESGQVYFKQHIKFGECLIQQISPYTFRPVCFTPEAAKYGQTSYMVANVVNQLFNWVICRTRRDSAILKRFTNKIYVMAIGFELMFAFGLCYTAMLRQLIGTRDLVF